LKLSAAAQQPAQAGPSRTWWWRGDWLARGMKFNFGVGDGRWLRTTG
jgi:hypothetical protein